MKMSTEKFYILRMDEHEAESWGEGDYSSLAEPKPANECAKDAPLKPEELKCIERAFDEESRHTRETMPLYTDPVTELRLPLAELCTRLLLRSQPCKNAVFYSVDERQMADKLVEQLNNVRNDGAFYEHKYLHLTPSEAGWTSADCAMIDAAVKALANPTRLLPEPASIFRRHHDADFCRQAEWQIVRGEFPEGLRTETAWIILQTLDSVNILLTQSETVEHAEVIKKQLARYSAMKPPSTALRTVQGVMVKLKAAGCIHLPAGEKSGFTITRRGRLVLTFLHPTMRDNCAFPAS
jgi:hypothetical protein